MTENRSKTVVIIALCLTLIFMGVGFAALGQQLTIDTTGTIQSSWDIAIHNFRATKTGTATVNPESYDTKGTSFAPSFTLAKPGDSVTFTGTIKNLGSIDAILQSITSNWDQNTGNSYDVEGVAVEYVLKDADLPGQGTGLAASTGAYDFEITYTFNEDAAQVPASALQVKDLIVFNYVQDNA